MFNTAQVLWCQFIKTYPLRHCWCGQSSQTHSTMLAWRLCSLSTACPCSLRERPAVVKLHVAASIQKHLGCGQRVKMAAPSVDLQLQLQLGYLVTSASRHLTKDYIHMRTAEPHNFKRKTLKRKTYIYTVQVCGSLEYPIPPSRHARFV